MTNVVQHPASYRDPAGFVFEHEGKIYRQVNQCYAPHYDLLMRSGLYELLVKKQKLVAHTELEQNFTGAPQWYKTLLPEQLPFISFPYEWCFGQWKAAALLTLNIMQKAMDKGMILKDATPFNIQFTGSRAVFIDTLSFETYDASQPWVAYHQFAECFLAPLLLARYRSQELPGLFERYPNGIPLALVAQLLPFKCRFHLNIYLHIYLPVRVAGKDNAAPQKKPVFSQKKLATVISSLESMVRSLKLPASATAWNNYYDETVLGNDYVDQKMLVVSEWLGKIAPKKLLDLGTNTGLFAEAAAARDAFTIAVDADADCINTLYTVCRQKKTRNLLPLWIDITNPSPAIGWNNAERPSFLQRAQADCTMALALVHHLAIGRNIGFGQMADSFSHMSPWLIIEFVPKTDPKVALLLQHRQDIFDDYREETFLAAFQKRMTIADKAAIPGTGRTLFLMKRNEH
jgi:hypothetical protein